MPYAESHTIHRDPSGPHAYDGDNALLSGLDAAALRRVAALTGPAAPAMCVVQLNHLGGAMARKDRADGAAGAVGHRDARFALRLLSPLGGAGDADGGPSLAAVRALHAEALAAVAPWRLGRSVNFLFGGHGARPDAAEVARGVHEAGVHRHLAALKALHDPQNLFRFHPAGAGDVAGSAGDEG
ncbi:hypothetical protein [Streptomyces kronopolitis]|uniref:hypothetical protein n=1 Tax=Streptomyces kronopolitis TaxID=1612435 RepID=UPI00341CD649